MDRKIVHEDKNLRLEYVKNGNYLHETWWGFTSDETFTKLVNVIVQELTNNNADGLLLDAREHKGLSPKAQKLAVKRIGEYANQHGKLKEAIIVPEDVFSNFSVENYSKEVIKDSPNETRFFDNIEKAEEWLRMY
ncbi:MAG: hypothetical protein JW973_13620 [Bacteroidales bacterium]|nr:hypothetical protein [Bacteroidales bacterium]